MTAGGGCAGISVENGLLGGFAAADFAGCSGALAKSPSATERSRRAKPVGRDRYSAGRLPTSPEWLRRRAVSALELRGLVNSRACSSAAWICSWPHQPRRIQEMNFTQHLRNNARKSVDRGWAGGAAPSCACGAIYPRDISGPKKLCVCGADVLRGGRQRHRASWRPRACQSARVRPGWSTKRPGSGCSAVMRSSGKARKSASVSDQTTARQTRPQ